MDSVSPGQLRKLLAEAGVLSRGPSHRVLAEGIEALTLSGRLAIGTLLPGERSLATALGVSRSTTTAAFRLLAEAGVIRTSQGRRASIEVPPGSAATLLRTRGEDVLDLSSGGPLPHDEFLRRLYQDAADLLPSFAERVSFPVRGLPELRVAIAARFTQRGLPTNEDQIFVTAGGADALRRMLETQFRPGSRVLVEQPTYPVLTAMLAHAGHETMAFDIDTATSDAWDPDVVRHSYVSTQPDLHYTIPDGHNPTGAVMSDTARRQIAQVSVRTRTRLLIDETTAELTDPSGEALPPLASYLERPDQSFVVGSLSKLYWPGMRVGWVRASEEAVARLAVAPMNAEATTSVFDQLTALKVFEHLHQVRELRAQQIRQSREAALEALSEHIPAAVCRPGQGFTLWVRLPHPVAPALCVEAGRRGVRLNPGALFGVSHEFPDYIRVPLVQPPHILRAGLRRVGAALRTLSRELPVG